MGTDAFAQAVLTPILWEKALECPVTIPQPYQHSTHKKIKTKIFVNTITNDLIFIGSNLTDHLVSIGHKVIILDNFVSGKKSNLSHHKKKNIKIIKIDISQNKNLDKYFKGIDYVFHLAGLAAIVPSIKNPKKYLKL